MRETLRRLALLSILLGLNACAGLAPSPEVKRTPQRDTLSDFTLEARFALHHADKPYFGRLSWHHSDDGEQVLLASPLGQGMAEMVSNARGARLTASDGQSYSAENIEILTQQVLGYPLPINKLADWVRGRSAGGTLEKTDAYSRPLHLREEVWRIDYEYDSNAIQALPSRLFIAREGAEGFDLRLRIEEWSELKRKPENTP